MPDEAHRLYELLRALPGADFAPSTVAALTCTSTAHITVDLTRLVEAGRIEEHRPGRYRLPAAHKNTTEDRALAYYLRTAVSADLTLNPHKWHLGTVFEQTPDRPFESRDEALRWMDAEVHNLAAGVDLAHTTGRHPLSWQLCEALRSYLMLRKHHTTWERTYTIGLASAEILQDPAAQGMLLNGLAGAALDQGNTEQAAQLHLRALDLWGDARHLLGQAASLEGLGTCELARQRPAAARALFVQALAIHENLGRERGVALIHRRLGEAERDLGQHADAASHFAHALDHFTESAEPYMRARALRGLAVTALAAGEPTRAAFAVEEALRISVRIGAVAEEAGLSVLQADLAQTNHRPAETKAHLVHALSIYDELGSHEAEQVRDRLAGLDL